MEKKGWPLLLPRKSTPPETNIFTPENGCMGDYSTFFLGRPIFRRYVSFRESTLSNILNPTVMEVFGSDDFPFQFWVIFMFQPLIFQGATGS